MTPGTALTFLAAYNLVQNALLNERGYVPGNLVATGVGLTWARSSGLSWREMGMSRETAAPGLVLGLGVASAVSSLAFLRRDQAGLRMMLDDDRLDHVADRELWYRLLVRFPLGTALFEEVWFRGILPSVLRHHGTRRPELVSNAAFAAWHLIPTAVAIGANPAGRALDAGRRGLLVVGGSVVAGIAGLGFAALRRASASLAAPWAAHATLNGSTLWIGLRHRRAASGSTRRRHGGFPRRGGSR